MRKHQKPIFKPTFKDELLYSKVQFYKLRWFIESIGGTNFNFIDERRFTFDFHDTKNNELYLNSGGAYVNVLCYRPYYDICKRQNGHIVVVDSDLIPIEECFEWVPLFLGYNMREGRMMTWQEKKEYFGDYHLNRNRSDEYWGKPKETAETNE